jgi:hypothetical protein
MDLSNRSQVVYPLGGGCLRDEQTVLGCEIAVAKRDHAIAAKRAAPQWTTFWPAFGICEQPFDEALSHPAVMNQKGQIDVDQRIGCRKPLPRESRTAKAIDDPFILAQQIGVRLSEFVLRDFDAPRSELHHVHDVEW